MNLPALALKVSEKFERAGSISQCTMAGLGRGKVVVTIGRKLQETHLHSSNTSKKKKPQQMKTLKTHTKTDKYILIHSSVYLLHGCKNKSTL